jgi:uncharacterized protein YbjT (DUF2867 family)
VVATVNTAAVARHHGVEAFVNMSQMTVSQMSISETTDSPQHKLHWLAEQALSWSGLPVVTVRPTVFLEGFFLQLAAPGVRATDELALPMGGGKTLPISAVDRNRPIWTTMRASSPRRSAGPSGIATSQLRRGAKASGRRGFLSTSSGISRPWPS